MIRLNQPLLPVDRRKTIIARVRHDCGAIPAMGKVDGLGNVSRTRSRARGRRKCCSSSLSHGEVGRSADMTSLSRVFMLSLFNCPQAAMMSRISKGSNMFDRFAFRQQLGTQDAVRPRLPSGTAALQCLQHIGVKSDGCANLRYRRFGAPSPYRHVRKFFPPCRDREIGGIAGITPIFCHRFFVRAHLLSSN